MFDKIKNIGSLVKIVIEAIIAIAGVFSFIYVLGQKAERKNNTDKEVITAIKKISYNDSVRTVQYDQLINKVDKIEKSQVTEVRMVSSVKDVLSTHIINTAKDNKEIVDMFKAFTVSEKKNGEIGMSLIPYKPEE